MPSGACRGENDGLFRQEGRGLIESIASRMMTTSRRCVDWSQIENHSAGEVMDKDHVKIRVLAVASGGGHWEQLMLLRPALDGFDVIFATTNPGLATRDGVSGVVELPDSNKSQPIKALRSLRSAWSIVRRTRPDFVITTGALPGLLCLVAGRLTGARTIWIDSVANAGTLSLSGRYARWFATLRMTQWEHLARPPDLVFEGKLL